MRLGIQEEGKKEKTQRESQEEEEAEIRRRLISSEIILMRLLESRLRSRIKFKRKNGHIDARMLIASYPSTAINGSSPAECQESDCSATFK
jgi:hypothetical protein